MNICPHDHDHNNYNDNHFQTFAKSFFSPVNNEGRVRPPRRNLLSAFGQTQDSKVLPVQHGKVVCQSSSSFTTYEIIKLLFILLLKTIYCHYYKDCH